MSASVRERSLEYVTRTQQADEAKLRIFGLHYSTIRREMERQGTWREGLRFLDLGCGLGLYAEFWHSRGFTVTGLDLNPALIDRARTRAAAAQLPIRYQVGHAGQVPFADGSFDVVYTNSLLEHVPDWEACLDEWLRVLAPGGLLWIETTNALCPSQNEFRWLPLYSWWPGALKRAVVRLATGPCPALANYSAWPAVNWFSYFQLKRFLERRGLSVRDRFDCMDLARVGLPKRVARKIALSGPVGRWVMYLLVTPLIVLTSKPASTNPAP